MKLKSHTFTLNLFNPSIPHKLTRNMKLTGFFLLVVTVLPGTALAAPNGRAATSSSSASTVFATPFASTVTASSTSSTPGPSGGVVILTKLIYPAGLPAEYLNFLIGNHAAGPAFGSGFSTPASSALAGGSISAFPASPTIISSSAPAGGAATTFTSTTTPSTSAVPATGPGGPHTPFIYLPPCGYPGSANGTVTAVSASSAAATSISTRIINGTAVAFPAVSNGHGTVTDPAFPDATGHGTSSAAAIPTVSSSSSAPASSATSSSSVTLTTTRISSTTAVPAGTAFPGGCIPYATLIISSPGSGTAVPSVPGATAVTAPGPTVTPA
ncbi:hypothetical protein DFP72DRAFT_1050451 [Ephemerocybe angulata]|uniref:Uncharacterized protein n=1 Tax=Ephemerocybe angulata TaxID=980116 RepID=A0A8H6HJA4_9AGAR|nr:hypothetical protein DFP72DRAFT_1050451 [Tulosesus angulatus]